MVVVDQHSGFNTATDLYDPWHPNAAGEEKMAVKWFQVLQAGPLARLDLMASADGVTFSWTAPAGADGFHIYRGEVDVLADSDGDGLADGSYGSCLVSQPWAASPSHADGDLPLPGRIFFYLVEVKSFNTAWGQGRSSSGHIRRPDQACP